MDDNTFKLAVAIIGAIVSISSVIGQVMIYRKGQSTHDLVNSMQARSTALEKAESRAAGVVEGKALRD